MDADPIDPERCRLREGAAQKPADELTGDERREMRALKTAQRAFQRQYCSTCVRYRCVVGGGEFIEKGHPNDAADCRRHWTDIMGTCWNYRVRPTPWYRAIEAYCARRSEARWRAIGIVARVVAGVMNRIDGTRTPHS